MDRMKAGLVPLFAGLYDRMNPADKNGYLPYIREIEDAFAAEGVEILCDGVCVQESDVRRAVERFEREGACAVAVLFLAYHPSLASAGTLSRTGLPVVVLDTTPCLDFGPDTDPAMIMPCHGIHGVQDLCCVLRRMGKDYMVEAGHYKDGVIGRAAARIRGCGIARRFRQSRVGLIGAPFEDMGDFAMPFDDMKRLTGLETVRLDPRTAADLCGSAGPEDIDDAKASLAGFFRIEDSLGAPLLEAAARTAYALSEWVRSEKLDALTFNFLDFSRDVGLPVIPFAAASLLMAGGTGYAGEGDALTAALTGAVLGAYPDTTFSEMFCPDWLGGTVFLSHMGEANARLLRDAALFRKEVPYVPGSNGGVQPGVSGIMRGGPAVWINLAPGPGGSFRLILSRCEIAEPERPDRFTASIRGWMRPTVPLPRFLERFSELGGTHHSCLAYGADVNVLQAFGRAMGWDVREIGA